MERKLETSLNFHPQNPLSLWKEKPYFHKLSSLPAYMLFAICAGEQTCMVIAKKKEERKPELPTYKNCLKQMFINKYIHLHHYLKLYLYFSLMITLLLFNIIFILNIKANVHIVVDKYYIQLHSSEKN